MLAPPPKTHVWLPQAQPTLDLNHTSHCCMNCAAKKNLKPQTPKNKKKPWVFLVFHNFLTIMLSKKPKKPWVFLVFSRSRPKKKQKNLGKTKKNQTWASDQTFSEKFWFFGFLEVFLILSMELSQRVSKYCFLLVFSLFLVFFWGFPHGFDFWDGSKKSLLKILDLGSWIWIQDFWDGSKKSLLKILDLGSWIHGSIRLVFRLEFRLEFRPEILLSTHVCSKYT